MNPESGPQPGGSLEVTPEDVKALAPQIADGRYLLIDCREDDEWAFNHLPGAVHTPLSSFATGIAKVLSERDIPCIIYCHHGMRSLRATEYLRSHGHTASWSMSGGIQAWSDRIDSSVPKY